jgi:pyruvate dehydrogenase complex dihydrolipoamide acetyltransferase long form
MKAFRLSRFYSSLSAEAIPLSPAVRFIVDTNNVDVLQVKGTGPKGRVLKGDVLAILQQQPAKQSTTSSDVSHTTTQSKVLSATTGGSIDEPLTNMRRTIAKRLTHAKSSIPHGYSSIRCRADQMVTLRKRLKEEGVKVSLNDLIIKVVAHTLKNVPEVNCTWDDAVGVPSLSPTVDISVAVATPSGLITPIIRNADTKSVLSISEEFKDLAERAKQGKLKPEEFMGGSFSISNLGMFGIREFTAIINPPQTAILAVGGLETEPVETDGGVETASYMTLTMSHNVVAIPEELSCHWLKKCRQLFENPLICV